MTTSLVDKIVTVANALDDARLPHAFSGALALAWGTRRARGTIDTDFHREAAHRIRREPFGGAEVAFLGGTDRRVERLRAILPAP
jgi:hypothetical protein